MASDDPVVKIPKGGLKAGLLMNDLTQVMSKEDADLVKKKLPFFRRSGPGLLPFGAVGALMGRNIAADFVGKGAGKGALIGGIALPTIAYALTRSGFYDEPSLRYAKKTIMKAREKTASPLGHALEYGGLGVLAVPSAKTLVDKKSTPKEKSHARYELGGLGMLAGATHLLAKKGSVDMDLSAFGSELVEIFEKTAGGFDRAARMLREAKGVASAVPKPTSMRFPATKVRGMPATGKVMHGLDRGALEPGKLKVVGQKLKAQGAQGV